MDHLNDIMAGMPEKLKDEIGPWLLKQQKAVGSQEGWFDTRLQICHVPHEF